MLLALVVLWLAAPVSAVLPVYRFMVVVFPRPVVPTWSNKYLVGRREGLMGVGDIQPLLC